MKFDAWNTT